MYRLNLDNRILGKSIAEGDHIWGNHIQGNTDTSEELISVN